MRNAFLLVVLLVATSCQTCSGVGSFTVTRDTGESVVEGSNSPLNDVLPQNVIPALELQFDLQTALEERDARGAKGVYLRDLTLSVTDTEKDGEDDEDTFDFLSRIEFYVESSDENSDLARVQIASLDPVPDGQTELVLDTDDTINLKPYAEEGIILTTSGKGSVPPDNVSAKGTVTIEVETL